MANEITKVTDQNGVDHPFKDVAAFPRSEQAVLGAKNICPTIAIGGRDSDSTLTYAVNTEDNTVTVDGTAAHAGWAVLANTTAMIPVFSRLAGKTIKFSGGLNNAKHLILRLKETGSSSDIDYISRGTDVDVPVPSNIANYNRIEILLSININTVCDNDVLKPMLSFDGGEYVAPAMTNKELTDNVTPILGTVTPNGSVTNHTNQRLYKIGKQVIYQMRLSNIGASTGANTKVATIPSDFAPEASSVMTVAFVGGMDIMTRVLVNSSGEVNVHYPPQAITGDNKEITANFSWVTK